MMRQVSSLWFYQPSNLPSKVERCIDIACEHGAFKRPKYVFFRADDVAVPGNNFARLLALFTTYGAPLSLAVAPAWLTRLRWQHIKELGKKIPSLLCWHQHGWRHVNHEKDGKKQEFGPNRSHDEIRKDIINGRNRLENLMEDSFYPVFTPPWNRCNLATLNVLKELGYYAVSRTKGSRPPSPNGLVDFQINVDLHTRKAAKPIEDWGCLFTELFQAISSGTCGVMIHHQRMNDAAFGFLELFLKSVVKRKDLILVHFKDMIANEAFS